MQRSEIIEKFETHSILPTPQRLEVADILLDRPQHLSAEQIIGSLRERGSSVSKATVYNTLNLFAERGLIKECLVDPERRFYDSVTDAHHHFYNEDTGELTDIPFDGLSIENLPQIPEGTLQAGVEVTIRVRNA